MEVIISKPALAFIIAQPEAERFLLLEAIERLEQNPHMGPTLPFPWRPEVRGFVTGNYWVTYRINNDRVEVRGVTMVPAITDIFSF